MELARNALVWGVVGNLGGGKSLTSVMMAVTAMRSGYFVCSNITLEIDYIARFFQSPWLKKMYMHISLDDPEFDPFALPCGSPRGSGGGKRVLVILDEVAEWIDQYSSAKDPKIQRLWSWLRHSSKRSQDVFIICQRQEYINKVVRILISRWVWVDDLAVWRVPFLKFRLPFCDNFVMVNQFDRQGEKISQVEFLRKSYWGQFYNTAECLNATGAGVYSEYYQPPEKKSNFLFLYVFWLFTILYIISL